MPFNLSLLDRDLVFSSKKAKILRGGDPVDHVDDHAFDDSQICAIVPSKTTSNSSSDNS